MARTPKFGQQNREVLNSLNGGVAIVGRNRHRPNRDVDQLAQAESNILVDLSLEGPSHRPVDGRRQPIHVDIGSRVLRPHPGRRSADDHMLSQLMSQTDGAELISEITDRVLANYQTWQNSPPRALTE